MEGGLQFQSHREAPQHGALLRHPDQGESDVTLGMGSDCLAKPLVDQREHLPLEGLRAQETIADEDRVTAPLKTRIGHEVIEDGPLDDVPVAAECSRALPGLAKTAKDE